MGYANKKAADGSLFICELTNMNETVATLKVIPNRQQHDVGINGLLLGASIVT